MFRSASFYFADRTDAGRQLAQRLLELVDASGNVVLGIPRGGVPVGYEVAAALHAPLDVLLSRKLGVPGNEELAFGAVVADDGRYLDESIVRAADLSPDEIERITEATRRVLNERALNFRAGRRPASVHGRTAILIDDGIATGSSMFAAVQALKQMLPAKVIIGAPVVPRSTHDRLRREVDEIVALYSPEDFHAVGQFYRDFHQTLDQEVIDLLSRANRCEQAEADHKVP